MRGDVAGRGKHIGQQALRLDPQLCRRAVLAGSMAQTGNGKERSQSRPVRNRDFLNPAVEVGLSIPGPGVAAAQQQWAPQLNDLARELSVLDQYELVLDTGDFARSVRSLAAADVTEARLASTCAAMVGAAHLRLKRRLNLETVAVQQVGEALAGVQAACRGVPALWAALAKTGPAGVASAGLDQGGLLPPCFALGRSYITASLHMAARPAASPSRLPWTCEPGPAVSRPGLVGRSQSSWRSRAHQPW